jgi:hypothetical protein
MIRVLLIGTLVLVSSCKKEPPEGDGTTKTEPKKPSFDCRGRSVTADYQAASGSHRAHLEIGCDQGLPYIRGTISKNDNEQPIVARIGGADFEKVWAALEQAKWSELPDECETTGSMGLKLLITSSSAKAAFACKGPLTEDYVKLVRALELVAPDQTFKGLEVGEAAPESPLAKLEPGMAADKAAIEKLLPGYQVGETDSAIEEGMRKIKLFTINKDDTEVAFARAEKGKVFAVRITEAGYQAAGGKATLGKPFQDTGLIKDCSCQGEDGVDGFHCELEGSNATLVFETAEGDCSLLKPEQARKAVQGRKPNGFDRSVQ